MIASSRPYAYQGRLCFVCDEWSGFQVSIRFGKPGAWQGEIIVDSRELTPVKDGAK